MNKRQLRFVQSKSRAICLIAPPGTGKTTAILERCLYRQRRTLLLTFTKAAAAELKQRLEDRKEFKKIRDLVSVSTLNAWGNEQLKLSCPGFRLVTDPHGFRDAIRKIDDVTRGFRRVNKTLGNQFTQLSRAKQLMEALDCFKQWGFRHDRETTQRKWAKHARRVRQFDRNGILQAQVGRLQTAGFIGKSAEQEFIELGSGPRFHDEFGRFWLQATSRLAEEKRFTFDDQKYWPMLSTLDRSAKKEFPALNERWQDIVVDEFQDINLLDLELLKALRTLHKTEVTLVGDDDQAVFEFRGACPEFLIDPDKHLSPTKTRYRRYTLTRNYRSPRNLVKHAKRLIQPNTLRVKKSFQVESCTDIPIDLLKQPNLRASVEHVLTLVDSARRDGESLAVVGRLRGQLLPFQIALAERQIPFETPDELNVGLSEAFEKLLQHLGRRAAANECRVGIEPVEDLLSLLQDIWRNRLPAQDVKALRRYFAGLACGESPPQTLAESVRHLRGFPGATVQTRRSTTELRNGWRILSRFVQAKTVTQTVAVIAKFFDRLKPHYERSLQDVYFADPPLEYLADFAVAYGDDFRRFDRVLKQVLGRLIAVGDRVARNRERPAVHLLTATRCKGMEFDRVVMLGANEGFWPHFWKGQEDSLVLEQERRLFYVALTRVRRHLTILVDAKNRQGKLTPSRFLRDMRLRPRRARPSSKPSGEGN